MQERVIDAMVFLLAQSSSPTYRDWYAAIDDMFGEFSEAEKHRMVEAGMAMLERLVNPVPVLQLQAA
ncbi:hypothetical protein [Methylobacterium nigriterrae]|uniref:hypothetical protein n=1 Tax=Methylobacterium nigriterrae TaxID=3127512 RepID=UPI0030138C17